MAWLTSCIQLRKVIHKGASDSQRVDLAVSLRSDPGCWVIVFKLRSVTLKIKTKVKQLLIYIKPLS